MVEYSNSVLGCYKTISVEREGTVTHKHCGMKRAQNYMETAGGDEYTPRL